MQQLRRIPVKILNGTALSVHVDETGVQRDYVDLRGHVLVGIDMPTTAQGWTAAALTFVASFDPAGASPNPKNFFDDSGAEVTVVVAVGRIIPVDLFARYCMRWMRVRSGTAATPVNQLADREIGLIVREKLD